LKTASRLFNDLFIDVSAHVAGAAKFAGRCVKIIRRRKALPPNQLGEFLLNARMVRRVGCRSRVAGRVA
jgi:hypothetical protein